MAASPGALAPGRQADHAAAVTLTWIRADSLLEYVGGGNRHRP
ncbi:hypothetical protein [Nocardiopsis dassonvillei]|nr:hypothetical protein [Nocardiopsis dassonvillei]